VAASGACVIDGSVSLHSEFDSDFAGRFITKRSNAWIYFETTPFSGFEWLVE
jgi:hypothetical protein